MYTDFKALKKASYVSIAAMTALLLLALVYWKERTLFLDASYVLFRVINDGQLAIQENRFGSFITQIVPLIAYKLHLPMKAIMLLYTASFNVFYLTVICLLVFRWKQYPFAILMSLYYLLYVTDTFYWSNNEVHQGIAWMFLLTGSALQGAKEGRNTLLRLVLFVLLAFLAVSSHMLVVMPIMFLWVYILLDKNICTFSVRDAILFSVILIALVWLKHYYSTTQTYDSEKLKATSNFSLSYAYEVAKGTFGKDFIKQNIRVYWFVPIVFISGIFSLLKDKRYWLTMITIGACALYYVIMCLTFSNTYYMHRFHIESEWMGLGIIAATPFVFSFLPKLKSVYTIWAMIVIVSVKLIQIVNSGSIFKKHVIFTEEVMTKMKEKNISKLCLHESRLVNSRLTLDWALPEESLILSAANGEKPVRTVFILHRGFDDSTMKKPEMFIGCFHNYTSGEMNPEYFKTDTNVPYQLMTYTELMK